VHVDDRTVYFRQGAYHHQRIDKLDASDSELFFDCASCQGHLAAADGTWFFTLERSDVLRVGINDKSETRIPLDWDHSGGGAGFLVDASFVYTAMPGCAALTRIDKNTLEKSVMTIDGIRVPGRGETILAKAGERLVCGSPSDIFLIESWGATARNIFNGVQELFGLTVVGEEAYWLEQHDGEPSALGVAPLDGSGAGIIANDDNGHYGRLVYAASIGKVIWASQHGLRAFDTETRTLGELELRHGPDYPIELFSIAADGEHLYATTEGSSAPRTVDGKPKMTEAYWIERIPLDALE
jgi:hypothetical protein